MKAFLKICTMEKCTEIFRAKFAQNSRRNSRQNSRRNSGSEFGIQNSGSTKNSVLQNSISSKFYSSEFYFLKILFFRILFPQNFIFQNSISSKFYFSEFYFSEFEIQSFSGFAKFRIRIRDSEFGIQNSGWEFGLGIIISIHAFLTRAWQLCSEWPGKRGKFIKHLFF